MIEVMGGSRAEKNGKYDIGIYVRESRDDNGENLETIETQRDLLVDFAMKCSLGAVMGIYADDNVSGSAFDREGLSRLKEDVEKGRINLVLLKDLSRLGRSNAKTLLFLDWLEEYGVRILTFDGRYDSLRDNDTVGIETWANERYIRDISRKIRASLKYKISKGDYIGNAPFGYIKSPKEKNRLCIDEEAADTVRLIFRLYRKGYGYSSIAGMLNSRGLRAPGGGSVWSGTAIRRITANMVYTGDTVQGVSEKITFKSKKTRRLPEKDWIITRDTHEAVITREEFAEVLRLREQRRKKTSPHRETLHIFRDVLFCGLCGCGMYARKKKNGEVRYICGNYYKYGRKACSSHYVTERQLLDAVMAQVKSLCLDPIVVQGFRRLAYEEGIFRNGNNNERLGKAEQQLKIKLKQQEMLYQDRLEERIGQSLFVKMNRQLEERISVLKSEVEILSSAAGTASDTDSLVSTALAELPECMPSNEMIRCLIERITVYEPGDPAEGPAAAMAAAGREESGVLEETGTMAESGKIVIDLRI